MGALGCERHILNGVWQAIAGCLTSVCVLFFLPVSPAARFGIRECKFKLEPVKMDPRKEVGTLSESLLQSLITRD